MTPEKKVIVVNVKKFFWILNERKKEVLNEQMNEKKNSD